MTNVAIISLHCILYNLIVRIRLQCLVSGHWIHIIYNLAEENKTNQFIVKIQCSRMCFFKQTANRSYLGHYFYGTLTKSVIDHHISVNKIYFKEFGIIFVYSFSYLKLVTNFISFKIFLGRHLVIRFCYYQLRKYKKLCFFILIWYYHSINCVRKQCFKIQ